MLSDEIEKLGIEEGLQIIIWLLLPILPSFKISSVLFKKYKGNEFSKITNIQAITGIMELLIPSGLTFLLFEYTDKYNVGRYYLADEIPFVFSGVFYIILLLEWIRRYRSKKDSYAIFRYIYVLFMIIVFILSIQYIEMLVD
ncbi:hypothetical protein D7030_01425 [Flavobacteriaceae bacterium AU392]|nr:hypothetical protein D1817_07880 [Flavobacteriaceae bacterium]RKM86540.1 hypothetical protein D7030_01425 [Flavobacteriaceae bacterium AU392]